MPSDNCLADAIETKMSESKRIELRVIYRDVRRILLKYWDPLEINQIAPSTDEYDQFALELTKLLYKKSKDDELRDYLRQVLDRKLLLKVDNNRIIDVIKKLRSIEVNS
jgi:hypothetical protein